MKAWSLDGVNDFNFKEVTDVSVDNHQQEEIVKVKVCGICGSDIPRVYRDGAHNMPLIIGHEFAGETVSDNRRVGVFPLIPCMKCEQCEKKHYEMCTSYDYLGSRSNGGFAEYVKVPKWNLIELPDNVSFEQAAMLEPMAVAVHAIRQVNPKKNDTAVVWGLGTIGMFITMFLIERGINNIIVVGNKEFQKEKVISLGIAEENYHDSNAEAELKKIEADVVFECVGKAKTYENCIDIANASGKVCLVGNPNSDMSLAKNVYWKILRKQLTLVGTWNSSFTHEENDDWHYVINCLKEGRIRPERFITHRFKLEEIDRGFEIMRDKKEEYIKIISKIN